MPIHPKAVYESGRKVAATIRRWSDDAPCDPARGVLAATDAAPSFKLLEREAGTGAYFADPVDAPGLPDDAYTVQLRDVETGRAFDWYSVILQGGDDTPKPAPRPDPTPAPPPPTPPTPPAPTPPPPRTALFVECRPGESMRFTILRLGDNRYFDFAARDFIANPAQFLSPLMAQEDGGPMRGFARASLPAAAPAFPDGAYQVNTHRGDGKFMTGHRTFPAVASGGVLRLA